MKECFTLKQIKLGDFISIANCAWLVIHIENEKCYIVLNEEYWMCTYRDLPDMCRMFEELQFTNTERMMLEQAPMVKGTIGNKIFVPTMDQLSKSFDYFKVDRNRIFTGPYWTATANHTSDSAWFVGDSGEFCYNRNNATSFKEFRPFACINLSKFHYCEM